ncbi:MAG: hypothetical protein JXA28_09630 [Bacteroidetes bacterium]|nr:hypothetical protein [Bacteroidota bacterium]
MIALPPLMVLLLCFFPLLLPAQMVVQPFALFLDPLHAEGQIRIMTGPVAGGPLRISIESGTPEHGSTSTSASCAAWCSVDPEEFKATAGQEHTVSLRVQPPADAADGEYRAFISVVVEAGDTVVIPLHFRIGDVYSDVKLANVGVERTTEEVHFLLYLQQLGNAAYHGNLHITIQDGKSRAVFESRDPVDIYDRGTLRYTLPASKVPKGRYKIFLDFDSDRVDLGGHALPVLPKKFTVEIAMS